MIRPPLLFSLIALLTFGCAVGPNYRRPAVPIPTQFSEDRPGETVFLDDRELIRWWVIFNDPFLNELLEETVCRNFDLRIAVEKIYEARAQYRYQFAQMFPQFDLSNTFSRSKSSEALANIQNLTMTGFSPIQNFYLFGFDCIWQFDVWGQLTRAAKSAHYLWEATIEDARAVKILVLSEVASLYVAIRAYQERVDIARQQVAFDQELVDLALEKLNSGLAGEEDVASFTASLEGDRAALKLAEAVLWQNIYSLATLLGRLPETLVEQFQCTGPIPSAAGKIPAGLTSDLLRRRPDIRSAERQLASATEEIGVAVADLFPQFSLTGSSGSFSANPLQGANYGFVSNCLDQLFNKYASVWGFGTFANWPILDFGRRLSLVNVQVALQHQALLNYQKTVIAAFQETETALLTYFKDEERLLYLKKQVEATQLLLSLEMERYQSGLSDYSVVVLAKEQWLTSLNNYVQAQQALSTDFIAVYKALGGEW